MDNRDVTPAPAQLRELRWPAELADVGTADRVILASAAVGLNAHGAQVIRQAENQIWRLPAESTVVRLAPRDRLESATREVRVARWLAHNSIRAVVPAEVDQPVELADWVATFWEEVPSHEHGTVADVARALKELHALTPPSFELGALDPFVRIPERLAAAALPSEDRRWLLDLHADLADQWAAGLPPGLTHRAVHGDAWPGNIVRIDGNEWVLMDFERFSHGPPEWDLASTAVRTRTTGAVTESEYAEFCNQYGHDVTEWAGYDLLARARELRMTTYAAQHAASNPQWQVQAQHRVDCLRGRCGPRPWNWPGIL
ncbi:aminoglycoside phosphotransferase family protein [Streptomyces sp. CFMR 7]|uniref:aminoglycoside phosphotransferase family protein n=1 Tax=Streptomyces sp. CFMR 7 TaxID=1649184 RepID=UPI0021B5C218|nr:aminoglycoside phosphotransferase family protein [Streptomyces sp. CFMR 7]